MPGGSLRCLGGYATYLKQMVQDGLKDKKGLEVELTVTDNIPRAFTFLVKTSCSYLQVWKVTQHSLESGQGQN